MHPSFPSALPLVLALTGLASAAPQAAASSSSPHVGSWWLNTPEQLKGRAPLVCNADNALRALRATQRAAVATPFCRAYISIPTDTVTVATVSPTSTLSTLATVTETATYTNTAVETQIEVVTVGEETTATATVTGSLARRSAVPVPDFMQAYPPERISSACSCLSLTKLTATATYTAPVQTAVLVATTTASASADVTETIQTTLTTSTTSTGTVTQTTVVPAAPTVTGFLLTASSGPYAGQYLKAYLWGGQDRSMTFTSSRAEAARFHIRAEDGTLRYTDSIAPRAGQELTGWVNAGHQLLQVFFIEENYLQQCGGGCVTLRWSVDAAAGNKLVAGPNTNGMDTIKACTDYFGQVMSFTLAAPGADKQGCSALSLVADYAA